MDSEKLKVRALKNWTKKKIELELHGRQTNFHEREIYWAGFGQNLGAEMYGKDKDFARPIIIYKKLSRYHFLAIPLTSKEHEGSWYVSFRHRGKKQIAVLSQARVLSLKRLYRKIGQTDDTDFERIKKAFRKLYC